jgi:hypothetical protein
MGRGSHTGVGGPRGGGGGEGEGDVEVRKAVGGRGAWGAMERVGQGGLVPGRVMGGRGRGDAFQH